jgi:hypothetical protein
MHYINSITEADSLELLLNKTVAYYVDREMLYRDERCIYKMQDDSTEIELSDDELCDFNKKASDLVDYECFNNMSDSEKQDRAMCHWADDNRKERA